VGHRIRERDPLAPRRHRYGARSVRMPHIPRALGPRRGVSLSGYRTDTPVSVAGVDRLYRERLVTSTTMADAGLHRSVPDSGDPAGRATRRGRAVPRPSVPAVAPVAPVAPAHRLWSTATPPTCVGRRYVSPRERATAAVGLRPSLLPLSTPEQHGLFVPANVAARVPLVAALTALLAFSVTRRLANPWTAQSYEQE
jgi:hypothetical protein